MFERVNLVPLPSLAARIKKITPIMCGALLLVAGLVIYIMGQRLEKGNQLLQQEIVQLEYQNTALSGQQDAIKQLNLVIDELKLKEKKLRKNVANLLLIPENKPKFSELLVHIGESVPATVRCEKITFNKEGGQISGTAIMYNDLPGFIEEIRKLERFHSVVLQVVNQHSKDNNDLLSFDIVFGLREANSF